MAYARLAASAFFGVTTASVAWFGALRRRQRKFAAETEQARSLAQSDVAKAEASAATAVAKAEANAASVAEAAREQTLKLKREAAAASATAAAFATALVKATEAARVQTEELKREAAAAGESALSSAEPTVPASMRGVYPFERFPANPGVIRHVKPGNFIIGFNPYLRGPQWVIEKVARDAVMGSASRKNVSFYEDGTLPAQLRVAARPFGKWQRGHMASSGAHKVNQKALESTFVMSNVVPQDPSNNGSDWLRLELWTRQLAKEYGDVIVVNAVGYEPTVFPQSEVAQQRRWDRVGELRVRLVEHGVWTPVPSYLLKAVCLPSGVPGTAGSSGAPAVAFFKTRNRPNASNDKSVERYRVSRKEFEALTGVFSAFDGAGNEMPSSLVRLPEVPDRYQKILSGADLEADVATCSSAEACAALRPRVEAHGERWRRRKLLNILDKREKRLAGNVQVDNNNNRQACVKVDANKVVKLDAKL